MTTAVVCQNNTLPILVNYLRQAIQRSEGSDCSLVSNKNFSEIPRSSSWRCSQKTNAPSRIFFCF